MVAQIIFYLLDVGTSNALVLHNFTKESHMSIVEFKTCLVKAFMGDCLLPILQSLAEHVPLRTKGRFCCAYCSLFNRMKRTRFRCTAPCCRLPLCSVGSGGSDEDCFTLCHANPTMLRATIAKFESMKKNYTNQAKTKER